MPDFLETLADLRATDAAPSVLFGDMPQRPHVQRYQQQLAEAAALWAGATSGDRRAIFQLQEVMTTSDFSYLTGDLMNRMMLAQYTAWQPTWQAIAQRRVVNDFRTVRSVIMSEFAGVLPLVAEQAEYEAQALSDSVTSWAVAKRGRRVPFSWELLINDDLGAFQRIPQMLGDQARRSEEYFVTDLFASSTGPDSTVYASGNANIVTANPALSIVGLQTAMTVLGNMRDAGNNPILIDMVTLEVPPALGIVAQNILNATQITIGADSSDQRLTVNNWMNGKVKLVVNPYLPLISTTNGATSWYLFANPSNGRPAIEFGFLRGHEQPEIFVKAPNAQLVGGAMNPMNGDFDTDTIQYKVRHVFGGAIVDPKMTVASNGTGS